MSEKHYVIVVRDHANKKTPSIILVTDDDVVSAFKKAEDGYRSHKGLLDGELLFSMKMYESYGYKDAWYFLENLKKLLSY